MVFCGLNSRVVFSFCLPFFRNGDILCLSDRTDIGTETVYNFILDLSRFIFIFIYLSC